MSNRRRSDGLFYQGSEKNNSTTLNIVIYRYIFSCCPARHFTSTDMTMIRTSLLISSHDSKLVITRAHSYISVYELYSPRYTFVYMLAIDQSHRYGRHQAACREPTGSNDKTTRTAISFEHKTQYLLIRAPYTRIVVFWHISNIPPMISQSQISCNTPTLYIAAIFVRYCYTTGSWLL